MSTVRSLAASALLVACAFAFSACSHGISVVADPSDLIRSARFIDSEDLPVPVEAWEVYQQAGSDGVSLLPGSEPDRLLIAVFGNACRPTVTVAAPEVTGPPQLNVASYPPHQTCGEILLLWPLEVILTRDVDPASVVLVVMSQPS
jgi:hypothetical protein